ncbi:MAG TPA: GDYXXLXY domain-containing protein [Burkholderiales bacterium]|nr:GDYXXLXY domain-containing protein [Burkholderiales bacterium]
MRSAIAILACVAVLALVNLSIASKERQLESGRIVYLELAPVDPRSLMQGDYMALRFQIANDALPAMPRTNTPGSRRWFGPSNLEAADGRIVAVLDALSIARYRRLDDGTPTGANELLLRYRVREGTLKFATNAFFFQEGTGRRYERARYGEFRVAPDGEVLLTGLRGKELEPLK